MKKITSLESTVDNGAGSKGFFAVNAKAEQTRDVDNTDLNLVGGKVDSTIQRTQGLD